MHARSTARIVGGRRRSALLAAALAVPLALAVAISPAGATGGGGPLRYGEKVDLAFGAWITETDTSLTDLTIRVAKRSERSSSHGNDNSKEPVLRLFYLHKELDPTTNVVVRTEYEGFVPESGAAFLFNPSFKSASVDMLVNMEGYTCVDEGPQGIAGPCESLDPITVHLVASWVGFGEIYRDVSNHGVHVPGFNFQAHTSYAFRQATLSGTATIVGSPENEVLASGDASFGILFRGKYHETMMMR